MKFRTKIIGVVSILAAGTGGVITGLGGLGGKDGELPDGGIPNIMPEVTIEQVAPVAVANAQGKKVFVVGEPKPEHPAITDSELGKVVLKDTISEEAICSIFFEAKLINKEETAPHGGKHIWKEPDFAVNFGNVQPVMIAGSCNGLNCIFNTMLKGQECLKALDIPGYLCSTMTDCLALPNGSKARFLRQEGTCTVALPSDGGTREVTCSVPYLDPRANPNSPVFIPHEFAGRVDLNPLKAEKVDGQYKAIDRATRDFQAHHVAVDAGTVEEIEP